MKRRVWRRFVPRRIRRDERTSGNLFVDAETHAWELFTNNQRRLEVAIEIATDAAIDTPTPINLLTSLLLQMPRAAQAQERMDEHPHGYQDKQARLYQLIDFNDTFVATVLSLTDEQLAGFPEKLRRVGDDFCHRVHMRTFTERQYEAIVHGLSREIAVYREAIRAGYAAEMTTRAEDAFGIDMRITDDTQGRFINVDVKTASSFHFRLSVLVREGRISSYDQVEAETKGYWEVMNSHNDRHVRIILLRISDEELGRVIDFSFLKPQLFARRIHRIMNEHSQAVH